MDTHYREAEIYDQVFCSFKTVKKERIQVNEKVPYE